MEYLTDAGDDLGWEFVAAASFGRDVGEDEA